MDARDAGRAARDAAREEREKAREAEREERRRRLQEAADLRAARMQARKEAQEEEARATEPAPDRAPPAAPGGDLAEKIAAARARFEAAVGGAKPSQAQTAAPPASSTPPRTAATSTRRQAAEPVPPPDPLQDILDHLVLRSGVHAEYEPLLASARVQASDGTSRLSAAIVGHNAPLIDAASRVLSSDPRFGELAYWRHFGYETLLLVSQQRQSTSVVLDPGKKEFLVGSKADEAAIVMRDRFVSRRHAMIRNVARPGLPPDWTIEDYPSTHGTSLDGKPVAGPVPFRPGSVAKLAERFIGAPGGAAAEHPTLTMRLDVSLKGPDSIQRLIHDCDLIFFVVDGDRSMPHERAMLKWASSLEKTGVVVLALVTEDGASPQRAETLDDLRHDAQIVERTRHMRILVSLDLKEPGSAVAKIDEFVALFRETMRDSVLKVRLHNRRRALLRGIGEVNKALQPRFEEKLQSIERDLAETQDRILGRASRAEQVRGLYEATLRQIKAKLAEDEKEYTDSAIVESLASETERWVDTLEVQTTGGKSKTIQLVPPGAGSGAGGTGVQVHGYILQKQLQHARDHFTHHLRERLLGRNPGGMEHLYNEFQVFLSGHPKFPETKLHALNYTKDEVPVLMRELDRALQDKFNPAEVSTSTQVDNVFVYMITKTRYSFMFYLSMLSITAVFTGLSRNQTLKQIREFVVQHPFMVVLVFAGVGAIVYLNYQQYQVLLHEQILEESNKLRANLKRHYGGIAKRIVSNAEHALASHIDDQERFIKSDLDKLGGARSGNRSEDVLFKNHPDLMRLEAEQRAVANSLHDLVAEEVWIREADANPTPSPLVLAAQATKPPSRFR